MTDKPTTETPDPNKALADAAAIKYGTRIFNKDGTVTIIPDHTAAETLRQAGNNSRHKPTVAVF